jgi:hypothetical protein
MALSCLVFYTLTPSLRDESQFIMSFLFGFQGRTHVDIIFHNLGQQEFSKPRRNESFLWLMSTIKYHIEHENLMGLYRL